ncbi:hypothetical protein [Microbacterium indicum]|uniref:hypothetical protein n=1 Tax=Microbacterium indicum TaxID=358100 RepID=UPI0003FCED49|nr:hypothetical protein [Microbacterium indicum]
MATAALGGTYVLADEGARQLADMVESGHVAVTPRSTSYLRVKSAPERLSVLQSMVHPRHER